MNEVSRAIPRDVSKPFTAKQTSSLKDIKVAQKVGQGAGLEG